MNDKNSLVTMLLCPPIFERRTVLRIAGELGIDPDEIRRAWEAGVISERLRAERGIK